MFDFGAIDVLKSAPQAFEQCIHIERTLPDLAVWFKSENFKGECLAMALVCARNGYQRIAFLSLNLC